VAPWETGTPAVNRTLAREAPIPAARTSAAGATAAAEETRPTATGAHRETPALPEPFWRRAKWLVGTRPVLATVVLGTALLLGMPATGELGTGGFPSAGGVPTEFAIFLLIVSYLLSVAYAATLTYATRAPWLIGAQLIIDVVVISMLVLLTGGSQSNFVPLYVLPILAGSVVRLARGGMIIAGVSATLFGLLVASQFGLVVPQPQEWGLSLPAVALPTPRMAFYSVGLHCVGFLAVAKLTGYLAENLHRADLRLLRTSSTLADLKAYNQHVIDSLTGGLAATDVHGRVLMFNRAAEAITGESAASVLGRPVVEVLQMPAPLRRSLQPGAPGASGTRGAAAAGDAIEPGRARRVEFGYTRRSGQAMEIGLSIGPLIGGAGQLGYLFTFQDLTDYKRREREEQRQKRLAAVGEMAAGIAHEIRNPLASMAGSMQVLRQELRLNGEQSQLFDIVLRESDRLNDTIRHFLAYARPHASKMATVDLRRVLGDAAQLIRNNPECQSRHEVHVDLPAGDVLCQADEAQIRQIVWNLATNGIRAMPDGGRLTLAARLAIPHAHAGANAPRLAAQGAPTDAGGEDSAAAGVSGAVVIRVADEGVGIDSEDLDRIFQPFHGGFAKGAGLGLSIVHRIVTDRGGEIRVSSQRGQGTAVEIHWPAPEASAAASAGRTPPDAGAAEGSATADADGGREPSAATRAAGTALAG